MAGERKSSVGVFWKKVGEVFAVGIGICLLVAVCIPTGLVVVWLKTGTWPAATIADALQSLGLQPPISKWIGLQKIIDGLLAWPLWVGGSLTSIAGAVVCGFFGYVAEEEGARVESVWRERQKGRAPKA